MLWSTTERRYTNKITQDASEVDSLSKIYRTNFNDNENLRKDVGGNKLGFKSQKRIDHLVAQKEKESIRKAKA